ncbi:MULTISPECIES: DNA-processing protein DprA [unclassified Ruegeria]|uniref:DNA-processing protein DprA n=1 Tax=unclassified Ruegeria TaxID=2625375 RepID=UPI00147DD9BD|nr:MULTISPECIES: DNA-processing protein DprA [unclassified Ruegeria]
MNKPIRTQQILGHLSEIEAKNAPEELFLEGDKSLLTEGLRVAIVGSRKASPEGLARARAFTKALVEHDITVVSGLAEGIDTVAHETAIAMGGKTIAVLGTPLSQAYPAKNKDLLEAIKRDHLAISQFPEGYPPKRDNFPRRNRTMALICDATVVVEAGEKSGTRHQGWEAIRLGRLVYIMQSVAQNPDLSWPKEMISYGAQVLRREDLPDVIYDIPSFTAGGVSAF